MPGDRERCLAAGIDAYLAKPIDLRTLIATIEAVPREDALPLVAGLDPDARAGTRIASLFLAEAPRQLEDVRGAMARRDQAALIWTAHRLKGAVANFGASAALDAAARLETMADSDHSAGADLDWAGVEEQLEGLTAALAVLLETMRRAE